MLMNTCTYLYKNLRVRFLGLFWEKTTNRSKAKMIFKLFALTAILLVCEGTFPDRPYYRRAPLRFIFGNQARRPNAWNYQVVNGRPVISGFPNPNAFVAFGLNPQTGQIEQTQIVTQSRPGGPFLNMLQNMLNVAGQFFGQLTGAFGNAVGGALQTAGKFGQDLTNPVISVTGISHPAVDKEPVQQPSQPSTEGTVRPTVTPSTELPSTPAAEIIPDQAKSDFRTAASTLDQALVSFQTLRTNVQANFQNYLESEEGQNALNKVNDNVNWAVNKLQSLRETAVTEPINVLKAGQIAVNTAFDNIQNALVAVSGTQGSDFIEPIRNSVNKYFNDALAIYQEVTGNAETEISPAK